MSWADEDRRGLVLGGGLVFVLAMVETVTGGGLRCRNSGEIC